MILTFANVGLYTTPPPHITRLMSVIVTAPAYYDDKSNIERRKTSAIGIHRQLAAVTFCFLSVLADFCFFSFFINHNS
jgi:adenine-specific DNA methylase